MSQYLLNPRLSTINPDFKGNLFADGHFEADGMTSQASFRKVLQWQLSANPQKQEKKEDNFKVNVVHGRAFLHGQEDVIVWLGHASFFIRLNGVNIITDPALTDLPFIKRKAGLPCSIKEFIGIDYMLLSHGHRDHFDIGSIKQLIDQNPNMELLLPLKISSLLGSKKKQVKYQEAAWWQRFQVEDVEIIFLPAKHWNRRGLFDFNENLWGSFMLRSEARCVYFAGDSAYASHFQEIREIAGVPDVCIMPVGAYKPPFIMEEAHMNPQEAITAFHDLQAKVMIPMHYGTYDLSDEPLGEPVSLLRTYEQQGKIQGKLQILDVGEGYI